MPVNTVVEMFRILLPTIFSVFLVAVFNLVCDRGSNACPPPPLSACLRVHVFGDFFRWCNTILERQLARRRFKSWVAWVSSSAADSCRHVNV